MARRLVADDVAGDCPLIVTSTKEQGGNPFGHKTTTTTDPLSLSRLRSSQSLETSIRQRQ